MSALDFAARGIGARNQSDSKRLATLDTLARGIAENLPLPLPAVMGTPIAEVRNSATQIASGKLWGFSNSNPANHYADRYTLCGAEWNFNGATELRSFNGHQGNGSDPAQGWGCSAGANLRFGTYAEKFELYSRNATGFRVRINGKYAKTGMYGASALNGDTNNALRYFTFDCAGTEFAGTGLKLVEMSSAYDIYLAGARVPLGYDVQPWPPALQLKASLHGDSMVTSVSDTGTDYRTAQHGVMSNLVQLRTGIADIWANNIGGAGFIADSGGAKSNFIEQAAVDFAGERFDLVWEIGGRNDQPYYGSEAAYTAIVQSWIAQVIADNPDAIVIVTGPLSVNNSESYSSSAAMAAMQRAKQAACAAYPRNCAFIPTVGSAAINDPWIFGTGRQGATAGNGNADFVTGNDGIHPTVFGHQYLATRLVNETARVIPLLYSRIRDGMIAGVNDLDLV